MVLHSNNSNHEILLPLLSAPSQNELSLQSVYRSPQIVASELKPAEMMTSNIKGSAMSQEEDIDDLDPVVTRITNEFKIDQQVIKDQVNLWTKKDPMMNTFRKRHLDSKDSAESSLAQPDCPSR